MMEFDLRREHDKLKSLGKIAESIKAGVNLQHHA